MELAGIDSLTCWRLAKEELLNELLTSFLFVRVPRAVIFFLIYEMEYAGWIQ